MDLYQIQYRDGPRLDWYNASHTFDADESGENRVIADYHRNRCQYRQGTRRVILIKTTTTVLTLEEKIVIKETK